MGVIYEYKIEKYLTKTYKNYCDIIDKPKQDNPYLRQQMP